MAKNVLSRCREIENWCKGSKDMSQKPYFQREHTLAQEFHFMKKVAGKGIYWCHVGVGWRKVAELG